MADGKKSFVLYSDIIHTVKKMPKDKVGELFITILQYVNDENPVVEDVMVDIAFEPIKQQLRRDLKKWEHEINRKSEGGKKGMEVRWGKKDKDTNKIPISSNKIVKDTITPITDNVNVNVNVTDTVSKKSITVVDAEKKINDNFFEFFRRSAGSHISDQELRQEVGRFRNKYPNVHANQSGGLINAWVANIGKEKPVEKKMVL
jgi:hypothetical protein